MESPRLFSNNTQFHIAYLAILISKFSTKNTTMMRKRKDPSPELCTNFLYRGGIDKVGRHWGSCHFAATSSIPTKFIPSQQCWASTPVHPSVPLQLPPFHLSNDLNGTVQVFLQLSVFVFSTTKKITATIIM